MKVAHVLLSPRIGGAETVVSSLDNGFKVRGVDSVVIYLDDSDQKQNRLRRFVGLRKKLKRCDAEHILAHSFLPALYARLAAPRRSSVHYVLHSASDDYDSLANRIIERVLLMRTKSVIAVSSKQLGVYLRHFRKNVESTVINNGVSASFGAKGLYRLQPSPFRVVTIARVSAQKRPAFWIEVAQLAHERNMNFVFEWWGPLSGSLGTDNLVLNNLPPNAFFMGPTEKPEIQLRTADIVFQTSDREAFSLSILEAAIAGIPQIYSDKLELEKSLEKTLYAYQNSSPLSALETLESIVAAWPEPAKAAIDFSSTAYRSFGIDQATEKYLSWLLKER